MKKDTQYDLALALMRKLPKLETLILAVDNDEGGDRIARKLQESIEASGTFSGSVKTHVPVTAGHDWNNVLSQAAHA